MIKIVIADSAPIIHDALNFHLRNSEVIKIVGNVYNYDDVHAILNDKNVDILVIDVEIEGFSSIKLIKSLKAEFKNLKILIFTSLLENLYASNYVKAGASAFVHKTATTETLLSTIEQVAAGEIVLSDTVKYKLDLISKKNKIDRSYRKLSLREIEVLRFLTNGKKNNEISKILSLNEKTISTYKLRLLNKLNVSNLVDLVNKAKALDVI